MTPIESALRKLHDAGYVDDQHRDIASLTNAEHEALIYAAEAAAALAALAKCMKEPE